MAKLVLSMNGAVQGEFALDREKLIIGRKLGNDIQIDNLAVSGKHAMIITILDDSFLEDLGSTNGTYANGKLVKKHALKDGDVIAIGKHELKYINENASNDDEDEFEKTMIIKPGSASAAVAAARVATESGVSAAAENPTAKMPIGRLTVLNGPIAGKELELSKALITLGKPGTQVAVISRRPQGYFLTHVESKDGFPIVNGAEITPKAYQLKNNDIIELATIKMEINIE
ncbi:hypothetical protein SPBRAN_552 [uncultured Candidatus Thioglobus sp.]|nr:hypothetical protein SPBRAN_552 [uncultured Candidatus Thioglobus sp.]